MNLFIVGDSHCHALSFALRRLKETQSPELAGVDVTVRFLGPVYALHHPFFEVDGGEIVITEESVRERFAAAFPDGLARPKPDSAYAIVLGLHAHAALVSETWKERAPWMLGSRVSPGGAVSTQALEVIVDTEARHILAFYAELKRRDFPLIAVSSPPFHPDHPAIVKRGTPPEVFAAVDRFYRDYVARRLEELEVPLVLPPAEAADANGFAVPRYQSDREDDVHHGNEEYGLLMLPRVIAAARTVLTSTAS